MIKMSSREWLKVIALILVPLNAWLGVLFYLRWQQKVALEYPAEESLKEILQARVSYFQDFFGIKEGQFLRYPFPYHYRLYGNPPPFGKGMPVLFLNISWIAEAEIWQPAIYDALKIPNLHVVLLHWHDGRLEPIEEMMSRLNHPRLSAIVGFWVQTVFGTEHYGILLILCDASGVVRAVEPYPSLRISPTWEEEVSNWRPKLHQAVKKVLDKFFPKEGEQR